MAFLSESDLTRYEASLRVLSEMARVETPSSMKMNLSTHYSSLKPKTTPTRIGNQNLLMLGLVSGTETTLLLHFLTKYTADFRANKPSDVISTLVSIYDSKDLFVKELQVLLAQRLLAVQDGNFEKEVWYFCIIRMAADYCLVASAEISRS